MEAAEQALANKSNNSLLKRIAKKLFPGGDQTSQALSPQPPDKPQIKDVVPGSGKAAREARKAAYLETKASSREEVLFSQGSDETPAVQMQEKPKGLPSGFKEVKRSEQTLAITQEDLPWMDDDDPSRQIPLVEITLAGTGQRFLYGSAILGKELLEAAEKFNKQQKSRIANNMLYAHLPEFVSKGYHRGIKTVYGTITEKPIYNIGNKGGQRVYFMRFDSLQDLPVIIQIAVCDKSTEQIVLGTLTTNTHKKIKQSSKL